MRSRQGPKSGERRNKRPGQDAGPVGVGVEGRSRTGTLRSLARRLRKDCTEAEQQLWRLLRGRQLGGLKFRRQHPMPPYVLDFYCPEARLCVELDGGQHCLPHNRWSDARRDAFLARSGIRVLRFTNDEVLRAPEAVADAIYERIFNRRR